MHRAREEAELLPTPATGALLADRRFAALWLNQALGQTAQYALLFTLLLVVLDLTGSSIHTTLLVLSFILPSVLLGMPVAVLLDRWRKESVLLVANLVRAMACLFFLFFHSNVWVIYGANLMFAAASQFFNPAVVALIPALVPKGRLINANTLYNFTLMSAQFAGIVFLTPALLKSADEEGMFILGAAFFAVAAGLTFFLHPGEAAHGDLGTVTPGDVVLVVSNSGRTPELLAIVPNVKKLGARLVALVGDTDSPLAAEAEVTLDASVEREACPLNLAPTSSTTAALAQGTPWPLR